MTIMDNNDLAFMATLLGGQTEADKRASPIPLQRLIALARNPNGMTPKEMATLLVSPGARARFIGMRKALPAAANDAGYAFVPETRAARDDGDSTLILSAPFGTLTVSPGPDAEVPHVLTMELAEGVRGGVVARYVTVWEETSNAVWLSGLTDERGILAGNWPLGADQPLDRLDRDKLRFDLAEEPGP